MHISTDSFTDYAAQFIDYVTDIQYATMITVDTKDRPRARVMLPIWEVTAEGPVGWLAAYRTPIKVAHLESNPHTTLSYWSPRQNAVHVDATAVWVDQPDVKSRVWQLYRAGSPPGVGYDPVRFWKQGPLDPEYGLLRFDPWRVQLVRGSDLQTRLWRVSDHVSALERPGSRA